MNFLDPVVEVLRRHQGDLEGRLFDEVMEAAFGHSTDDLALIKRAHRDAIGLHYEELRDDGESYIHHPRAAALILTEYLGRQDAYEVVVALLHDCPEHHPKTWHRDRLVTDYSATIADDVMSCNRNRFNYIPDKERRNHEFLFQLLSNGSRRACAVKVAEFLHNGLTPSEKQLDPASDWSGRKLLELIHYYIPMARKHQVLYRELIALTYALKARTRLLVPKGEA